ncbi:asparagine synthetase [glutamine-hydrolyzing] [Hydra vulgaris]|uniref:Asparagine synthetase [glutamine-hydrolyzing] n=1 Tax=Hydra vulgaris TaxID=6087 RepID=A0ABM4CWB4_HYDVU
MCGIWALFGYDHSACSELHHALELAHRGPDFFRIESLPHFQHTVLAFHRLSIMDDLTGQQPMRLYELPHLHLMYNGEIFNYKKLVDKYGFKLSSGMDGEVILHMYNMFGIEKTVQSLDGDFAIFIFDSKAGQFHIARDTFGVRPLFTLQLNSGEFGLSSEVKGLVGLTSSNENAEKVMPFLPGTYATFEVSHETGKVKKLIEKRFTDVDVPPTFDTGVILTEDIKENIRNLFVQSVKKRLMSERRIGCLLSGGLDSSLVAALVVKLFREEGLSYPLQTFSIGLPNSPDLIAARKVATMLGTEHHEVLFTPEEAFNVIEKVNYTLESYDITTNRASIPMYLLGQYISKNTDTVVVFSGEGSDELTQGYIYFHKSPSADDAHEESKRLLRDLYLYDNLRADRSVSAHGLELRVPFLDKTFTSYFLSLPKEMVQPFNGIEKYLLRSAFDGYLTDLLPDEVLWRPKEAFSDGVSTKEEPWYAKLENYAKSQVSEAELQDASLVYLENTPKTCEALLYRKLFTARFPGQSHLTPYFWMPKWISNATDPSARTLQHYKS